MGQRRRLDADAETHDALGGNALKIVIGEVDGLGTSFALPVDVVTSTLVVYGGKGMGKTNFGSVLVEQLTAAGLRWAALDPLGVWWGLRHSADGKGDGIECLILGGSHGDIPIEPTGGAVVADLVIDETVNVIIDFSRKPSGEMWSIGEKVRFVTDYAYRLFQRQGELVDGRRREPIFQVLDEAARYIPQIIPAGNPDLAKCVSAWEQLVEEGRNIGIGVGLLTQRSARMNKSVSEVADAIFAFRIVGPNSIAAIMDWLGEHVPKERIKNMIETVRSLDVGHCLIVSPGWLKFEGVVTIRYRSTFDSSATPKPGERARKVKGEGARPDLSKYADRMKATIERARENDPKALKQRIAELNRELQTRDKAGPAAIDEAAIKRQVESSVSKFIQERDQVWLRSVRDFQRELSAHLERAARSIGGALSECPFEPPDEAKVNVHVENLQRPAIAHRTIPATVPDKEHGGLNGSMTPAQRRILGALSQFEAIGVSAVPKKWAAALAGVSHSSSSYTNNLGALRSAGLIEYVKPASAALTDHGRTKAPAIDPPRTSEEMLERCLGIVTPAQGRILSELHKVYPQPLAKDVLAERAGVSANSSSFTNNLGALRSAGMIDYPATGAARCSDWLFLT